MLRLRMVFKIHCRILIVLFVYVLGDCDHLAPYPVYSETHHQDINLSTGDKPWLPEIDWLKSYVNLSSYNLAILQFLAIGYKTTKHSKFFSNSEWGCMLKFAMDPELADAYFLKHFAYINYTVYICIPHIPVRPDMRRKYVQRFPDRYSMVRCYVYELGFVEHVFKQTYWSYIFSDYFPLHQRIIMLTQTVVAMIGVFGELKMYTGRFISSISNSLKTGRLITVSTEGHVIPLFLTYRLFSLIKHIV